MASRTTESDAQGPGPGGQNGIQASFEDLGTRLIDTTFVVVDLETTGGSPALAEITEIGAVKVRGGAILGEFATLVNPGAPIPALIAALTGITDAAVRGAPSVPAAVASFLAFSQGAVLVAHNAPYDMGFLRGACTVHSIHWPRPLVVDTARLARAALLRDEAPNYRLATLARIARSPVAPNHRALIDARATVDVLHFLIDRVGDLGVTSVEELTSLTTRVSPQQRRKRTLADGLPNGPGVYQFLDHSGSPLYIGTSRHVRDRVRTYFTATEKRTRMAEMVGLTDRVTVIECATALESAVRETRLLVAHKPPYNRRSRFPERQVWVRLTAEAFPRLSVVNQPGGDPGDCLGPFPNRRRAGEVVDALIRAFPIRSCTMRLSLSASLTACIAADLGQCAAPCDGRLTATEYAAIVAKVRATWHGGFEEAARSLLAGAARYSDRGDYERAGQWRDAALILGQAIASAHRTAMLARCEELVVARPTAAQGWEVHVVRHGRLAAAGIAQPEQDPRATVARLQEHGEVVATPTPPMPAADLTEMSHVAAWLAQPGTRIVVAEPALWMPATSAHATINRLLPTTKASAATASDGEHRGQPGAPRRRLTRIDLTAAPSLVY